MLPSISVSWEWHLDKIRDRVNRALCMSQVQKYFLMASCSPGGRCVIIVKRMRRAVSEAAHYVMLACTKKYKKKLKFFFFLETSLGTSGTLQNMFHEF